MVQHLEYSDLATRDRYVWAGVNSYKPKPVPSFDTEVLEPLRSEQARLAAEEAARAAEASRVAAEQAQAVNAPQTASNAPTIGGGWEALRQCESGGNYATNTGNGYYGAYQYDISTWANYGGYARPDLAPPAVQDAKAQETFAARGSSPWPVCGRFL